MVPSIAKPCAIPMPKPISCPRRFQVAVKAPRASRKCHEHSLERWVLHRHRIVEHYHHAVISIRFERTVVLDDDLADGRMVVARAALPMLPPNPTCAPMAISTSIIHPLH